ncbi:MAG: ECF-type sigma factor [Planctomycetota bacterium]
MSEDPGDAPPPSGAAAGEITRLLVELQAGNEPAHGPVIERVYGELRTIAAACFRSKRAGVTLQPTALVNEVFLKLIDRRSVAWQDRQHFFAFAARVMRDFLVDRERERAARKRGGDRQRLTLDENLPGAATHTVALLDLNDALERLAQLDERQARLVDLRYFGGLEVAEAAQVLGVSKATAERDWRVARAWLGSQLRGDG